MRADGFAGVYDVRQVRLARFRQRRRYANDDGVNLGESPRIGGGVKSAGLYQFRHTLRADVSDVALTLLEALNFFRVDVEAQYGEAASGERLSQRQADVTHADDAHGGCLSFDLLLQLPRRRIDCCWF